MIQKKALFILGNPRSGTSLFRIMLASHNNISIPPECGFIQWWWSKYKAWSLEESKSDSAVKDYIEDLKTSKKIETWNLDFEALEKFIHASAPKNYSELCLAVLQQFAIQNKNKEVSYLGDKNNYYIHHLELLKELFPEAYFLIMVRDGRDVACSYKNMSKLNTHSPYKPNLPQNIPEIAKEWKENNLNLYRFYLDHPHQAYFLRYEDLVTNTQRELMKICEFLDIEFDLGMLNYAELNAKNSIEPSQTLDWKRKTLEKPDKGNIAKYKTELTPSEIKEFEEIAGTILDQFNYKTGQI